MDIYVNNLDQQASINSRFSSVDDTRQARRERVGGCVTESNTSKVIYRWLPEDQQVLRNNE